MNRIYIPRDIQEFSRALSGAGHQCWVVGGAVRDSLLGKDPGDFDIATDARPEEVVKLYRSVIPTGIRHGTVTVLWRGHSIEVTTFRSESGYSDGRHPDRIEFGTDIGTDLSRRDFTINALAWDCREGKLLDLHGGRDDLAAGMIRAIGEPVERFREDGLRLMRAIRFASVLGFDIETRTFAAIEQCREGIRPVSAERVRDELSKLLVGKTPSRGLGLLEKSGILSIILPELARLREIPQSPPHRFDALGHSFSSCDGISPRLELRLAALLHDLGKATSRQADEAGVVHFFGHEKDSGKIAKILLSRLKFPNAVVDAVCHLVVHHMNHYSPEWTDAALRRFVSRVGEDSVDDEIELIRADAFGLEGCLGPVHAARIGEFSSRIAGLRAAARAFSLKDLSVKGSDLVALGLKPGPATGRILAELLETVLDDPDMNDRERLLVVARSLVGKVKSLES